jgi:hypothetical protein
MHVFWHSNKYINILNLYCLILSFHFTETAGLAVTYGLSLNMLQGWAIAVLCSLENRMISVERMLQYMSIPSEPPLTISESRPDCHWPTKGEIELCNLHVRIFNFIFFFSYVQFHIASEVLWHRLKVNNLIGFFSSSSKYPSNIYVKKIHQLVIAVFMLFLLII